MHHPAATIQARCFELQGDAVTEINSIPLAGQGTKLPPNIPYIGEWLLDDYIFLYEPADQLAQEEAVRETTVFFQHRDSEWCVGINAIVLALDLGVGCRALFAHNWIGTLMLVRVDDGPAPTSPGQPPAKRYIFQIDDRQAAIVIEGRRSGDTD
jgi:hypothetical protein